MVDYYKLPPAFPYAVPAIVALGTLFFTIYGSGSAADWLRAKVDRYAGPAFLKFSVYAVLFFVSNRRKDFMTAR